MVDKVETVSVRGISSSLSLAGMTVFASRCCSAIAIALRKVSESQDTYCLLLLIGMTSMFFSAILSPGFVSYFDLALPAPWMKVPQTGIAAVLAGYTGSAYPLYQPTFYSVIYLAQGALASVIGPYAIHVISFIGEVLLVTLAYAFGRYFGLAPVPSMIIAALALFNPFYATMNIDSVFNVYKTVFMFVFFMVYMEFALKRRVVLLMLAILVSSTPPIYGPTFLLLTSIAGTCELAVLVGRSTLRGAFRAAVGFLTFVGFYFLMEIGVFLNREQILKQLGVNAGQYSNFGYNIVQIVSFQSVLGYQNATVDFFIPVLALLIMFSLLLLFICSIMRCLYVQRMWKDGGSNKSRALISFSLIYTVFAIALLSYRANYGGLDLAIAAVYPEFFALDPWDMGAFVLLPLLSWTALALTVAGGRKSPGGSVVNKVPQTRGGGSGKQGTQSRLPARRFSSVSLDRVTLAAVVVCALVVIVPFGVLTYNLNTTLKPADIPPMDQTTYRWLQLHTTGYLLTLPSTYALSFRYSVNRLNGIGAGRSVTDATFWWNYPPAPIVKSGPLYSQMLSSLYSDTPMGGRMFDILATAMGVEYVIVFQPTDVTSEWGAAPPIPASVVQNLTGFYMVSSGPNMVILGNPWFRGLAYTTPGVVVSSNLSRAIEAEAKLGVPLPILATDTISSLPSNRGMTFLRFEETPGQLSPTVNTTDVAPLSLSPVRVWNETLALQRGQPWTSDWNLVATSQDLAVLNQTPMGSKLSFSHSVRSSEELIAGTPEYQINSEKLSSSEVFNITRYGVLQFGVTLGNTTSLSLTCGYIKVVFAPYWEDITIGNETKGWFLNSPTPTWQFVNGLNISLFVEGHTLALSANGYLVYAVNTPQNGCASSIRSVTLCTVERRPRCGFDICAATDWQVARNRSFARS